MVKFNKTDKTILSVATVIILFYSYLLYDDSFLFPEEESSYQKIGILSNSANDVRRKPIESFMWSPTKKQQQLHEKDSIFTGEKSQAEVILNDGSILKLEENSLITLSLKEGDLELNLKYGEIKTELREVSKVQIKSDKGNIILQNNKAQKSKVIIKKANVGPAKVDLIEGSLSLLSKNKQEKITLNKAEPLTLTSDGKVNKVLPGNISLLTPNESKISLLNKQQGFYLNWKGDNTNSEKLLIASDKSFNSLIQSKENISGKVFINELEDGTYFWKVEGLDGQKQKVTSPVYSFNLKLFSAPKIIAPESKSQLSFESKGDLKKWFTPITVEWQSEYTTFEYQVSKEIQFKTLVDTKKTTASKFIFNATPGQYYVKVRAIYNNTPSPWSEVTDFIVAVSRAKSDETQSPLAAPQLLTKKLKLEPPNSRAPASITPAQVKWSKSDKAFKYVLEFDETKDFKSPNRFEVKSTYFNFTPTNSIKYFYRVKAIAKNKQHSPYSQVGELSISLKKPTLEKIEPIIYRSSKANATPPAMDFSLNWSHVPIIKKYIIQYSQTPDFKAPKQVESSTNKTKVKVEVPGTYHFRVVASINSATPVSLPSNIQAASYEFKKKLQAPVLNEPRNRMTVFLQQEIEPFIWINWNKENSAKRYEFQISSDNKFSKIIITKVLDDNKFLIKEKLPLGKIFWRVRSLTDDPGLTSDWSGKREFILLHNKNNETFE